MRLFLFSSYSDLPVSVFVELLFKFRVSLGKRGAVGIDVKFEIVELGLFARFELPGTFNVELDAVLLSVESKK